MEDLRRRNHGDRMYPDLGFGPSPSDAAFGANPPSYPPPSYSQATGETPPYPPPHQRPPPRPPSILDSIKRQFVVVVIGTLLFAGGIGITFWNEGRSVRRSKTLQEGLKTVASLEPSPRDGRIAVNQALDSSLVHLSARLSVPVAVSDPSFPAISVQAARIQRVVEMLQWVEHETETEFAGEDGITRQEKSYNYVMEWRSSLVHSIGFSSPSHHNPDKFPMDNKIFVAPKVFLGPFLLGSALVEKMSWFEPLDAVRLHKGLLPLGAAAFDKLLYFGNPHQPVVGDFRVSFAVAGRGDPVNAEPISIVAQQTKSNSGPILEPFVASNGDRIDFVQAGVKTPDQMFAAERRQNLLLQWAFRAGGWFLMFVGSLLVSDILPRLFSGIPLFRDVAALASFSLSLVVSGSTAVFVIALGWVFHRPWMASCLFLIAFAPFVASRFRRR